MNDGVLSAAGWETLMLLIQAPSIRSAMTITSVSTKSWNVSGPAQEERVDTLWCVDDDDNNDDKDD